MGGDLLAGKRAAEEALRRKVATDPRLAADAGAWDKIAQAQQHERTIAMRLTLLEGFPNDFLPNVVAQAKTLVRYAAEIKKPNGARLEDYTDADLPGLKQNILQSGPDYPNKDKELLAWWLTDMRFYLGADDADVKAVLGGQSPDQIANGIVSGTKMGDAKFRAALLKGGPAAIEASDDPLLVLMRRLEGPARKILADQQNNVDAVVTQNAALIADAKFKIFGTSVYPDATASLRVSYGTVKGYEQDGRFIAPVTNFAGAFGRATGQEPFKLPPSWLKARDAGMDMTTGLNMATDNDIVGGNSGSPVIDREGRIAGLIFDGDIQSLGGAFGFDESVNRAVAVDATALKLALGTIYHADRLVKEMGQ